MIDCHIHTEVSPDSEESAERIILHAIENNFSFIAITDHMDIGSSMPNCDGIADVRQYIENYRPLKEKYSDRIDIAIGIECGYTTQNKFLNAKRLENAPLDYVINSIHEVSGTDCYFPTHFDNKSRNQTFTEYLEAVLESLNAPYHYNTIAHLGYIERTAPYENPRLEYSDFPTLIDEILKTIIKKDKIIELNTNVRGAICDFMPRASIVKRYFDLGGRNLTFSSDSHQYTRLGDGYDKCVACAKSIGFDGFTIVKDGKLKRVNF